MLPAATGLDGGEVYDAEHIGGGGAGRALGPGQLSSPSFQRGAYPTILAGRFVTRPLVYLGNGGRVINDN